MHSEFCVVVSAWKRCWNPLYLQLFVGGLMSCLCYYMFVWEWWCPTHIVLCFFLRLMYPMLPVYLDCPFFIAPSLFSSVYFLSITLPYYQGQTSMSRPPYYLLQNQTTTRQYTCKIKTTQSDNNSPIYSQTYTNCHLNLK